MSELNIYIWISRWKYLQICLDTISRLLINPFHHNSWPKTHHWHYYMFNHQICYFCQPIIHNTNCLKTKNNMNKKLITFALKYTRNINIFRNLQIKWNGEVFYKLTFIAFKIVWSSIPSTPRMLNWYFRWTVLVSCSNHTALSIHCKSTSCIYTPKSNSSKQESQKLIKITNFCIFC